MPFQTIKNLYNFLFILVLGSLCFLSLPTFAIEDNLFISEINFRGGISSSRCIQADKLDLYEKNTNWCGKDQWLEIYNPTKESVNLSGWSVEFRGGKTTSLEGFSVKPDTGLVMAFNQQNFASLLPNKDLVNYNLLYLSSESGKEEASHNITAILRKNGQIIDQINIHPSNLDADYLNTRGKSFFRCQAATIWQKSTKSFDSQGQNFGTPGFIDPNCPQTKPTPVEKVETPKAPPTENIPTQQIPPKIDQIQPTNQIETNPSTNLQTQSLSKVEQISIPETQSSVATSAVEKDLPVQNILEIQKPVPQAIQTPQIKIEAKFSAQTKLLNLNPVQHDSSILLKTEYQNILTSSSNEEMLFLNLLTLTGLVFNFTNKLLKFNFKNQFSYVSRY